MCTIQELSQKRFLKYAELSLLKDDINDYIKSPVETVPLDNLLGQYSFLLREINNLDVSIKTIILTQIEWAKRDLKNLELLQSQLPNPFHVDDLPKYSTIFK
jgi:hypothetical protein